MPTNKKEYGRYFSKDLFWGCIIHECITAWDSIFKTKKVFMNRDKYLKFIEAFYDVVYDQSLGYYSKFYSTGREDEQVIISARNRAIRKLNTIFCHSLSYLFPVCNQTSIRNKNKFWHIAQYKNGEYKNISKATILRNASKVFDEYAEQELKLIKEKKGTKNAKSIKR